MRQRAALPSSVRTLWSAAAAALVLTRAVCFAACRTEAPNGVASLEPPPSSLELSAKLSHIQIDLPPADLRTLLVTKACPPQMVHVRGARRLWSCTQFELQKLVGSGKTSNVYQVRAADHLAQCCLPHGRTLQACCIRSSTIVAMKVYPKARFRAQRMGARPALVSDWRTAEVSLRPELRAGATRAEHPQPTASRQRAGIVRRVRGRRRHLPGHAVRACGRPHTVLSQCRAPFQVCASRRLVPRAETQRGVLFGPVRWLHTRPALHTRPPLTRL